MEPGGPSRLDLISKAVSKLVVECSGKASLVLLRNFLVRRKKRSGGRYQKETETRNAGRAELEKGWEREELPDYRSGSKIE